MKNVLKKTVKIDNLENSMFCFISQLNLLITQNFQVLYLRNYIFCAYSFYMILIQCKLNFRNVEHKLRFGQVNCFATVIYCSIVTWIFFWWLMFKIQLENTYYEKCQIVKLICLSIIIWKQNKKSLTMGIWWFAAIKNCRTLQ